MSSADGFRHYYSVGQIGL